MTRLHVLDAQTMERVSVIDAADEAACERLLEEHFRYSERDDLFATYHLTAKTEGRPCTR